MNLSKWLGTAFTSSTLMMTGTVMAQEYADPTKALKFLPQIADTCIDKWNNPACHEALIDSNREMVADYTANLVVKFELGWVAAVTDNCAAASTFMLNGADRKAVSSAFIECANVIDDAERATGLGPDLTQYQMMTTSALCLQGAKAQCNVMDNVLMRYERN